MYRVLTSVEANKNILNLRRQTSEYNNNLHIKSTEK